MTIDSELAHLIKMANQIAANANPYGGEEKTAEAVASHIERFWAPSMREKLADYAISSGEELNGSVVRALDLLSADN